MPYIVDKNDNLADLIRQLRWSVAGLRMGGIRDWVRGAEAEPERTEKTPESMIAPSEPALHDPEATTDEASSSESIVQVMEPPAAVGSHPEQELSLIQQQMGDCKKCRLQAGRTNLVFGDGSPHARLVFVGEGPGFDEDRVGRPFVGKAGRLLDKMIRAIGFARAEVYICNVVKCRPPNNRTPNQDEIESCSPFLASQLQAIQPQVICALGACAAQTLLGTTSYISSLRGKIHRWRGIPLVCTYHPAYLLRSPAQKAAVWQDLLVAHRVLLGGQS